MMCATFYLLYTPLFFPISLPFPLLTVPLACLFRLFLSTSPIICSLTHRGPSRSQTLARAIGSTPTLPLSSISGEKPDGIRVYGFLVNAADFRK